MSLSPGLRDWLTTVLPTSQYDFTWLAGDASFRRYFRVQYQGQSFVVMDAPPDKETCLPYVRIANSFSTLGVAVPEIMAADVERGFIVQTDFGNKHYIDVLSEQTADALYRVAFDTLLLIQSCEHIEDYALPPFDAALYRAEMNLFRDWYLGQHVKVTLSAEDNTLLDKTFDVLIEAALAQPQVCVHRDYHSRNLMVLPNQGVGVLDFQDAVIGPITYDLVSLLRDCYIDWRPERVQAWMREYQVLLFNKGFLQHDDIDEFTRWFDWMGLQRHLKCIGIFARLCYRDGKQDYLQHIPRVMRYVQSVCDRYNEFAPLGVLLSRVEAAA